MRVTPITFFNNIKINPVKKIYSSNPTDNDIKMRPALAVDTVSFGRVAENAEPLRKMIKYGALDIWTGKPPIDPDVFEQILKRRDFNRTIKTILKIVEPLKESLHKVPLEIYNMLEEYAKIKPEAHLDEILRQWTPLAQRQLLKIQQPIFKKLTKEAKLLPEGNKLLFDELMRITQDQIQKKPIIQDFDKRDFRYKLERIAQKIRQRNIPEEVSAINKLIKMSGFVPATPKTTKFKVKRNKDAERIFSNQKVSIRQMKNFFERSIINKDEELQSLLADVKCQIYGIPTFIPFGRLNFIERLKEITKDVPDQSLARRLLKIALKLPTANQETSAFIVKESRKPAEKIGYDWLWGCVGNIDHIDVYSKGGKDGPSNYAISTNYTNSERSNRSFAQQLRAHPEAYQTCQMYIDKLIEFDKDGLLKMFGLNNAYLRNFAAKLERRSPSEKPLRINLSSL